MKVFKKLLLILMLVIVVIVGALTYSFSSMNNLPEGEFITEAVSPDGAYTLKAYLCNGGATVAYCVRGELNYNKANKKPKNIYWDYRIEEAVMEWTDNDTVIINGHSIDVLEEKFDWRKNN